MLGPAADLGVQRRWRPAPMQALDRAGDEGLALDPLFFQQARDLLVAVGLQETERKVFHFPPICQMPSRLANGAYRSGSRARTRRYRASCSRRASAACAAARPGRISTMRVGCHGQQHLALHFLLRTAFGGDVAGVPGHHAQTQQRPRALHQPRATSWPNAAATGSLRSAGAARSGRWAKRPAGPRRGNRVGMHAGQDANHARAVREPATPGQGLLALETRLGPGHGLVDQRQAVSIQALSRLLPPGSVERRRRVWNGRG